MDDTPVQGDLHRLKTVCRFCFYGSTVVMLFAMAFLALLCGCLVVSFVDPGLIDYSIVDIPRVPDMLTLGDFRVVMVLDITMVLIGIFVITALGRIFRSISEEYTPFTYDNYRRLLAIASMVLVSWVLRPLQFLYGYSIDVLSDCVTFGIVAVLIYALALVFRYGQFLQKESDETL